MLRRDILYIRMFFCLFCKKNFYPVLFILLYFIILVVATSFWWGHIQITIMIDTQQQCIKLNIRGEISIIVMNKFFMTILRLIRRVHQFIRVVFCLFCKKNFYPVLFTLLYFIILVVATSFWWDTKKSR
jgi:hypothetical protein